MAFNKKVKVEKRQARLLWGVVDATSLTSTADKDEITSSTGDFSAARASSIVTLTFDENFTEAPTVLLTGVTGGTGGAEVTTVSSTSVTYTVGATTDTTHVLIMGTSDGNLLL